MRLTQIKLSGFKSFADSTGIHIPGKLVAVVGPNGCGKSNVIDAVRWVLGESSAKQLRGESMQDVIFNGTHNRKMMSRAAVELIFDNSDFVLQGPWGKYSEVTIKRTLTRSGESNYLINNQIVRRRDITDLFLGTGVGSKGYAIIEQGMIARIIEARPEDLRGFIEEAAGVSKYKERRRETENRLKDSLQNLQRLEDLQTELKRQVDKLQTQATLANQYRNIQSQLLKKQNILDALLWQQETAVLTSQLKEQTLLEAQIDGLQNQQIIQNDSLYQSQLKEYDCQQYIQEQSQEKSITREKIARMEEQIRYQQNLLERQKKEQIKFENDHKQFSEQLLSLTQQQEELTIKLEEEQYRLGESELIKEALQEDLQFKKQQYEQFDHIYLKSFNQLNEVKQTYSLLDMKVQHIYKSLSNEQAELKMLTEISQNDVLDDELSILQENLATSKYNIANYEIEIENKGKQLNEKQTQLVNLEQEAKIVDHQYWQISAQINALKKIQEAIQYDQDQYWHEANRKDYKVLWQHVQVDEKWQRAFSALLGNKLWTRLAPAMQPNQEEQQVQAAWINQSVLVSMYQHPQALINHITSQGDFATALNIWLRGVLCINSLSEALERQSELQENEYYVTPEGYCVDRCSINLFNKTDAQSVLSTQKQLDDLHLPFLQLEQQRRKQERELEILKEEIEKLQIQHQTIQLQNKEMHTFYHELQQKWLQVEQKNQQIQFEKLQQSYKQNDITQSIVDLEEQLQHYLSEREELVLQLVEQESIFSDTEQEKLQFKQQVEKIQNQVIHTEHQCHQLSLNIQILQERQYQFSERINDAQQQLDRLNQKKKQSELLWDDQNNETLQMEQYEALLIQADVLNKDIFKWQNDLKQYKTEQYSLHEKINQLSQQLPNKQKKLQDTLLNIQEAQLKAERYLQNLQDRNIQLADIMPQIVRGDTIEAVTSAIARYAQQLKNVGAVNLVALEELEQATERQQYYTTQEYDIKQAIVLLEDAMQRIDAESKQLFKKTFDAVNHNMQHYFPILFGGGEATLQLTGEDLLNTGLSIIARPPGKKNSTIHLLSGGEKALTAMSLVFSLFSLNPAPFCLLDEVDAPLDDVNTNRFCQMVKEMSHKTQFLYISHNRLTMEMAEQLIGVTMQEKGISRIVTVDIQKAMDMAETVA